MTNKKLSENDQNPRSAGEQQTVKLKIPPELPPCAKLGRNLEMTQK
jgi:hypothetical protein